MTAPRDLADAQARLTEAETTLAALIHENNELRAIIRRVREYAHEQHQCSVYLRSLGTEEGRYHALPYENSALALERIIGDQP